MSEKNRIKVQSYASSKNLDHHSTSSAASSDTTIDFDSLLIKENGKCFFSKFLNEANKSVENLLTVYLILNCYQTKSFMNQENEQILDLIYRSCFVKNEITHLNNELKEKLAQTLRNKVYDESVFNAVKQELKNILEREYFPLFLESKLFKRYEKEHLSSANTVVKEAGSVVSTANDKPNSKTKLKNSKKSNESNLHKSPAAARNEIKIVITTDTPKSMYVYYVLILVEFHTCLF